MAENPIQTRRQQLLFQEGDLLFSIGVINPGAPQRQCPPTHKDLLHGSQGGFQQQEGIVLWPAAGIFNRPPADGSGRSCS